jgi:hypothetical protein
MKNTLLNYMNMSAVPSSVNIVFKHEDDQESIYSDHDFESIMQWKSSKPVNESPYSTYTLAPWPQGSPCTKKTRFDLDRGYNISPLRHDNRNWIQSHCDNKRQTIQKWRMDRNQWEISKCRGIDDNQRKQGI